MEIEWKLKAALAAAAAAEPRVYYDEAVDRELRERYYAGIDAQLEGEALRRTLAELLSGSHDPQPRYKPMLLVYPWVDLHPDRKLRSVCSGKAFAPQELIEADSRIEQQRSARPQGLVVRESALGRRARG